VLTNPVDQLDQPVDRLAFGWRKVGTIRHVRGRFPEFMPAAIEINEIADGDLLGFLACWLFGIVLGIAHIRTLMQTSISGRVKKV